MSPRSDKLAFVAALLLTIHAAWNLWAGAPRFAAMAKEWSLAVPSYAEPILSHHKLFALLPILVVVVWLLPQTRKHRGWICLGIGLLSLLVQATVWSSIFSAPGMAG